MKIPAWLSLQVVSLAVIGVLGALLVRQCNATQLEREKTSAVEAKAKAQATQDRLEREGLDTSHAVELAAAEKRLDEERQRSAAFSAEVERLTGKVKGLGAKLTSLEHGTTGAFWVGGDASADAPAPAADPGAEPPPSAPGSAPVCRLAVGDRAEIETWRGSYEVRGPVLVLAGAAALWKVLPGGREEIWSGRLTLESDYVPPAPPPGPTRLGLGLRGQCVPGGCASGLAGAWQPHRHLEINGDASFYGAKAAKGAGLSALVRW